MKKNFLSYCQPSIGQEEIKEVIKVLKSGWLAMGPKTAEFEKLLTQYTKARHAVVVNSCTAALHLSLISLQIGKRDEVITTPYTFVSTANVILHTGAKPVFVDIDRKTYNIDPSQIEKAITKRTKAIIPVHFAGQPCKMEEIMKIAKKYNLFVIEDAAHAIGAEYEGKKIGTFGKTTCFSFYATKNITTGEGGCITTNDDYLVERFRTLRLHGMDKDAWKRYSEKGSWYYEIKECGWKYNMIDIQAALGIQQIKKLDKFIKIRRKYAKIYNEGLKKIGGIITPYEEPNVKHTYHLYPILLKKYNRDKFIKEMYKRGIGCSVHFIPLHLQPFYKRTFGFKKGDFPNAEWVYEREVSLPLYPKMSKKNILRVIKSIKKIIK